MLNDLRFALRSLRKAPGFTLVAIGTLALGIGANTAIFSLIDRVFLHGLPFARTRELVRIYQEAPERNMHGMPTTIDRFEHFRDHQTVFTALAADFFSAP